MVSIGVYAAALHALGLLERLAEVAAAGRDEVGLALAAEQLPKRVRLPRNRTMADIEVQIEFAGGRERAGTLHRQPRRRGGGRFRV